MASLDLEKKYLAAAISRHSITIAPRLNRLYEIYKGKHKILDKSSSNDNPCNKIILDYPRYITDVLVGYFLGKPVTYVPNSNGQTFMEELKYIYKANNEQKHNIEIAKEASVKGEAFEIVYINSKKEIEFVSVPAEQMCIYYKEGLKREIDFAIRYYSINDLLTNKTILKAELYTKESVKYFTKNEEEEFILDQDIPHPFDEVPIIHYVNNLEKIGDWEKCINLIDDLENRISENADELEAFRNAYIIFHGFGQIDPDKIREFKEFGAMALPDANDGVDFLTKNINDNFSENHIKRLIEMIHKMAMVPDLADEKFGNDISGVAIQFKLYCMEQVAANKELYFKEALTKRLKLIANVLNKINLSHFNWDDIDITFTRNMPANLSEYVDMACKLKDIISDETLLSQLPFITDVKSEMQRLDGQAERDIYRDRQRDTFMNDIMQEQKSLEE